MSKSPTRPDWVPPGGGEGFATRVVAGVPAASAAAHVPARSRLPAVPVLAERIAAGDRTALARGITLVESRAAGHRAAARELLERLTPRAGGAQRVGITGVPGAGKSTFIDALGLQLCEAGQRVAVLSVDPSSPVSGGSILGDKTRMERLSRHRSAFIRPSPSGCELGGVARRTRESITLCEAAGFNVVLVETVGVGQSEVVVREMVDCFLVLMIAGAGDELQGMKKGIIELADVLAVNKADGDNRMRAEATKLEFARALHYLASEEGAWSPPVLSCSATTGPGVAEVWSAVQDFFAHTRRSGAFAERRRTQALAWLQSLVEQGLQEAYLSNPAVQAARAEFEAMVAGGQMSAPAGARRLLTAAGLKPVEE